MNKTNSATEIPLEQVEKELYEVLADKTLSFGCKVRHKEKPNCGIRRVTQNICDVGVDVVGDNGMTYYWMIKNLEVIGHKPTLNDVLLALGEDWAASSSGIYKGEDCFDSIDGYDLAKSFDAQSELTHRKLHNLITK